MPRRALATLYALDVTPPSERCLQRCADDVTLRCYMLLRYGADAMILMARPRATMIDAIVASFISRLLATREGAPLLPPAR